MKIKRKNLKIPLVLLALIVIGIFFIFAADFSGGREQKWGVTFSKSYALDLQLDWQETYLAILDDLKVSQIRLGAYWNEIEKQKDKYDFRELDWQVQEATKRNVEMVLVIGRRLPRWPECHQPDWVKSASYQQNNAEVLQLLEILVNRYKNNYKITAWQIENEPLFAWFGDCPAPNEEFLKQEIALVKSLDPNRPIIITDSGELSNWRQAASLTDILGITMYRIVWNKDLGFWDYWFVPPAFYHWKADLTKFFQKNLQQVIVTEMQMEPWSLDKHMVELTPEQRERTFDLKRFKNNLKYVRKTGFPEVYFWGVEYWYWLEKQGQPEIWQEAKRLWQ